MKYISIDRMNDFEFHDAGFTLISHTPEQLVVSARCLNIHKGADQNPRRTDMEIDHALITFRHFAVKAFDPGSTWRQDAEGKWFEYEQGVVFTGEEALQKCLHDLREEIQIYHFVRRKDGRHSIDAAGSDSPWFEVHFTFDSMTVEWDEYLKPAWYEENARKEN